MDSPIGQAHACAMPVAVNSALLYVCCLHLCSNIHVKHLRGFRLGWIISSALCGCESCTARPICIFQAVTDKHLICEDPSSHGGDVKSDEPMP